jgi:hypothetical protein
MPTCRALTFALALPPTFVLIAATTSAGAYPRSDLPSIAFTHNDWELACDNTRTCRAAGYRAEDSNKEDRNASILLTRKAGPGQPVEIQLQLADDPDHPGPPALTMTIDGRSLGHVNMKDNMGTLSQNQTAALLPALLKNSRVTWTGSKATWTVSTSGANAVLLKMDEFQGRLDTPGALVRKGGKPEAGVLPPLPLPEIRAARVISQVPDDNALPPAQQRTLRTTLAKACESGRGELGAEQDGSLTLSIYRLNKDKLLVAHTCWIAAYNTGDAYWVVNSKPPFDPVLVTDSGTEYADGVISSVQKGRGIADCMGSTSWTWDGRAFAQTAVDNGGMCREIAIGGAWNLPTLVTRVHKAP